MSMKIFPQEEYEARWEKVHGEMQRRGYDVAVVWSRGACTWDRCSNLLWLVNHFCGHPAQTPDNLLWQGRGHNAAILRPGEVPELHIDELLEPHDWIATDRVEWHMNPIKGVADALNEKGISGKVAFVGTDFFPCKYMDMLTQMTPGITWAPEDDLVKSVQHIKSARELDVFREAGDTVTIGMNVMMEGLVAGKTEAESAADGAREIIKRGGMPYIIKCSHGTDKDMTNFAGYPLTGADFNSPPKKGDLVRGWLMGPMRHGYYLDPGRTAVCGGKPTQQQRDLMEGCIAIVEGVMKLIRPGVLAHDLAREGDRLAKEYGGGDSEDAAAAQWPLYGHLCDHMFENPMYGLETCGPGETLEENMVCSSEAFLTWEGVGAAGFEQNLIVTKDGPEVITNTPMRYWD